MFSSICHLFDHLSSFHTSSWRVAEWFIDWIVRYNMVSSANSLHVEDKRSARSLTYNRKRQGPNTERCGTPDWTCTMSEYSPAETTCWVPFVRKASIDFLFSPGYHKSQSYGLSEDDRLYQRLACCSLDHGQVLTTEFGRSVFL